MGSCPSIAGKLSRVRGLAWWQQQQQSSVGERHRRRHFPFLMSQERAIGNVIGGDAWRAASVNRKQWKDMEATWILQQGVEWTSGRQHALEG